MNKIKSIIFSLACLSVLMLGVTSCDDDVVESTEQFIPLFQLNGDPLVFVTEGDRFDDPGASATEGPDSLDITIVSDLDLDNYGVYTITYAATGSRGDEFSAERTVVVTPDPATITGPSIAGDYFPTSGPVACGLVNTMQEVAPGAYYFDWYGDRSDCIDGDIFCYIFCLDGVNMDSPLQPIPANIFGQTSSVGTGTYDQGTNSFTIAVTIFSAGATLTRNWQQL